MKRMKLYNVEEEKVYYSLNSITLDRIRIIYRDIDKYLYVFRNYSDRVKILKKYRRKLYYYGSQFKYNYINLYVRGEFENHITDMNFNLVKLINKWQKEK